MRIYNFERNILSLIHTIFSKFDKVLKPTNQEYIYYNSQIILDLINSFESINKSPNILIYIKYLWQEYKSEPKNFHIYNTLKNTLHKC